MSDGATEYTNGIDQDLMEESSLETELFEDGRRLASFNCNLEMRWTRSSYWQEEYKERFWCLNVYRKKKGGSLRTIFKDCRRKKTNWDIRSDGTIRYSSNKCLEREGISGLGAPGLRVRTCNGSRRQKFRVIGNKSKLKIKQGSLYVTSQHHPKEGDGIQLSSLSQAKRHRILYWKCY